MNRANIDRPV